MSKQRTAAWPITVIIALIVTIVVNALANILPFNGMNTGEVANQYEIFFYPAAYVFSIWTVIYIGLAAYTIYAALPAQRSNKRIQAIAPLFVLNAVFNSVWMAAWHYNMLPLTVVLMLGILLTLIVIFRKLQINSKKVAVAELLYVQIPFRIYLGWISVATIANVSVYLDSFGIEPLLGLGDEAWATIMIVIAAVLACAMLFRYRDVWFSSVVVWALFGIMVRFPEIISIQFAAGISSSMLIGMIIAVLYLKWKHQLLPLERKKQ